MTQHIVRAPGKTMWIGEYVVLDGAPAVVAAVDRHAICRMETNAKHATDTTTITTSLYNDTWTIALDDPATWTDPPTSYRLLATVLQTLHAYKVPHRARLVSCHFDSGDMTQSTKLGIGSSAAIAATAVLAFSDPDQHDRWTPADIHRLTQQAHQRFQGGLGSGADVTAACYGGVLHIQRERAPRALHYHGPAPIIAYTGHAADTATFVRRLSAQKHHRAVQEALHRMIEHTETGIEALHHQNQRAWIASIQQFHRAETRLGVAAALPIVTPEIEHIVQIVERWGGGGKASGAGGGDIVLGFFEHESQRKQAVTAITQAGYDVIPLAVQPQGVLEGLCDDVS